MEDIFKDRLQEGKVRLEKLKKTCNELSISRLVIFAGICVSAYFTYKTDKKLQLSIALILLVVTFVAVVIMHAFKIKEKRRAELYIKINERALDRIGDGWKKFEDSGEEFKNVNHNFSMDLDIFGKNSLFQWINSTITDFGRRALYRALTLNELPEKEDIIKTQEATRELSEKLNFKQSLQIEGLMNDENIKDVSAFISWCRGKDDNILNWYNRLISIIMPFLLLFALIAWLLFKKVPYSVPLAFGTLNSIVIWILNRSYGDKLKEIYEVKNRISSYFAMITLIEKENFTSMKLLEIKDRLKGKNGKELLEGISEYNSIISMVGDRANGFYIIFDVAVLWDYKILRALEKWRRQYGIYIETWFDALGEVEALASLSNINNSTVGWSYGIVDEALDITGENVGHPLIQKKAVVNSFNIGDKSNIMLVTGSNMSGKSTFLRTVGLNTILTYIGAPCYATYFKCPILKIYTCMRIGDNLEESISSFYAELLRIKQLVEGVERGEKVLFLLDEIFKGTNSLDRHTGAEILINQLREKKVLGVISTHDLELCKLEEENNKVVNYNFREYYENGKIGFDYKLRKGPSTTRNAIYLMRMAGIKTE